MGQIGKLFFLHSIAGTPVVSVEAAQDDRLPKVLPRPDICTLFRVLQSEKEQLEAQIRIHHGR